MPSSRRPRVTESESGGYSRSPRRPERRLEIPEDHAKVLLLSTDDDTRADALAAGEALSATLLECTMAGLATCPVTHLTELSVTRELIRSLMDHDAMPQVLIRVGVVPVSRESTAAHTATSTLSSAATQGLWRIVMRDSTKTPLPIVVGIDGSQAAIQAAEWAVDEAVSREVPLRLVEVITRQAEPAPLASVGNVRMEVEYARGRAQDSRRCGGSRRETRQSRDCHSSRRSCGGASRRIL